MVEVIGGSLVVGAFGTRSATLEAVGDWREIRDDGLMQTLTRAGVFGRATSVTPFARARLIPLRYRGHVHREGYTSTHARLRRSGRPVSASWPPSCSSSARR